MTTILGYDVAAIVADTLRERLSQGKLTRTKEGGYTAGALTSGPEIGTNAHDFTGFDHDYKQSDIDGNAIRVGDFMVTIVAKTLPEGVVPVSSDKISINGRSGVVQGVKIDAASATMTCQVR